MILTYVEVHIPIDLNHAGHLTRNSVSSLVLSALVAHMQRLIGDHYFLITNIRP